MEFNLNFTVSGPAGAGSATNQHNTGRNPGSSLAGIGMSASIPSIPSAESTNADGQKLRVLRDAINVKEVVDEEFRGSLEHAFMVCTINSNADALTTLLTHPQHWHLQQQILLQLQVEGV